MKFRGLLTTLPVVAVAGCIGTGRVVAVTTEMQAVRIAKERCAWTLPFEKGERWRAALRNGQWHVWLTRDADPREPVVGTLDVWIRARDGHAGDCNHS
jgi:hypothetical protein